MSSHGYSPQSYLVARRFDVQWVSEDLPLDGRPMQDWLPNFTDEEPFVLTPEDVPDIDEILENLPDAGDPGEVPSAPGEMPSLGKDFHGLHSASVKRHVCCYNLREIAGPDETWLDG